MKGKCGLSSSKKQVSDFLVFFFKEYDQKSEIKKMKRRKMVREASLASKLLLRFLEMKKLGKQERERKVMRKDKVSEIYPIF